MVHRKATRIKKSGQRGDILLISCNAEIRHNFNTHIIQGKTITSRIFIDCSKMFDSRMFYTVISRARRLDQIYLVCKNI